MRTNLKVLLGIKNSWKYEKDFNYIIIKRDKQIRNNYTSGYILNKH